MGQKKLESEKPKLYVASCSFGKDSIATILLALENNEPLDRVVFIEVMFDHEKGISGEIPEHIEWIYDTAIPKLEAMGVKVDVVRAKKDYKYFFTNSIQNGKYKGRIYGFPVGGKCVINRDCKIKPIKDYYKQFAGENGIIHYIGIAVDEPKRLARLKDNMISLLAKYGYTEQMAMKKCAEYKLVSPIYKRRGRGGCWFCMNAHIKDYLHIRKHHSHLWEDLRELSQTPNLYSYGFKYGLTLEEVERKMDILEWQEKHQLKLFE